MRKDRKSNKLPSSLILPISSISLVLGFLTTILLLFESWEFTLSVGVYLLAVALCSIILGNGLKDLFLAFLFPIYPISIMGRRIYGEEGNFEAEDVEIPEVSRIFSMDDDMLGIPIVTLRDFGTKEERMNVSKIILSLFKAGEMSAREAVQSLEKLTHDPHLDVAMYASDGLTSVENTLLEKIARAREKGKVEELVESLYEYATSGLIEGEMVGILLEEAMDKASKIPDVEKRDMWVFKIKEFLKYGGR